MLKLWVLNLAWSSPYLSYLSYNTQALIYSTIYFQAKNITYQQQKLIKQKQQQQTKRDIEQRLLDVASQPAFGAAPQKFTPSKEQIKIVIIRKIIKIKYKLKKQKLNNSKKTIEIK